VIVLGRWGARKDLANEVDDSITTSSKFSNDFEFLGKVLVVYDVRLLRVGDKAKDFTQERKSHADRVARGQDVLYMGGNGRANLGGSRAGRMRNGLREGG
jgi:hypothetical protein